jgi:SAM-dependent MidA family methyltransferase
MRLSPVDSDISNTPLADILRNEIAAHGPVTFARFMEQALYHPLHGYYASGRARIGRRGDFFTNVSVGALFGRLLAAQFAEMWERMGKPARFTVVEQGAFDGAFACDVIAAAPPDFLAALDYVIIEPFTTLQARQHHTLAGIGKVRWVSSPAGLEPFSGVHFSNELIDALPVHLLVRRNGAWRERFVAVSGDRFLFTEHEPSVATPPWDLPDDYETEARPAAACWLNEVAAKLLRGHVLAIDYGFLREDFFRPDRKRGTLQCYSEHRRGDDPLVRPGEQDITAHVEFTALMEEAERIGLANVGFTDQHHFITALGAAVLGDTDDPTAPRRMKEIRAFRTLMHPDFLGTAFKVLCLAKNVPAPAPLTGFRFSGTKPCLEPDLA